MAELQIQHISHIPRECNNVADAMAKHSNILASAEDNALLLLRLLLSLSCALLLVTSGSASTYVTSIAINKSFVFSQKKSMPNPPLLNIGSFRKYIFITHLNMFGLGVKDGL